MEVTPRVKEVRVLDNTHIYLKFADGKEKIYDMRELIEKNQFYMKLKNKEYFNQVAPRGTSIEWPDGEDVCPENLYYDSLDFNN